MDNNTSARSLANQRKPLTLPQALSIVVDKPNPTQRDAMILKQADDHTADIQALQALLAHPDAGVQTRRIIDKEIRSIGLGHRGENEAAYEINFHFGPSPNWVVIHDLRIETEHRVAQIDHLLINRLLDVWVCETKYLSGGLAINEFGECTTFLQGNRPQGIPSPFEQNRKHCALLQAIFDDGHFPLPRRLGIKLRPSLNNIVLIAKRARISRPKTKIDGVDSIIKTDQLRTHIDKSFDDNPFQLTKLVSSETLTELAQVLVSLHCPIKFDWHAKFGLSKEATSSGPALRVASDRNAKPSATSSPAPALERQCFSCARPVSDAVIRFCTDHRTRFGGQVYCRDCQREFAAQQ